MEQPMILAGDIGGTKTLVALFEGTGDDLRLVHEESFPSGEHRSLEEILGLFQQGRAGVALRAACFGVAGPVVEGKSRTTNLPWELDAEVLSRVLGAPVKLLNDLEAMGYGMLYLRPEELLPLNPGAPPRRNGNVAVIAAGTGLGEGMLYWDGRRHHPLASEGGHADFAPRTDQEIELLRWLRARHGHVSYERVLSGPGLYNVFSFLRESGAAPETPALAGRLKEVEDPNIAITELGVSGADPLCAATLELFGTLYGAEAGNLALKCVALGGVFVGGGIAPHIVSVLQKGCFLRGFLDKGRFDSLLKGLAVQVALNPNVALLGAAHYASQMV
jgi:glucokinase